MAERLARRGVSTGVLILLLAAVLITQLVSQNEPADADHLPADKVVAAGSSVEQVSNQNDKEILTATLKTSSPTDLILSVTAECALWTDVQVTSNDTSQAVGRVEIWVTVDNVVVPVNSADTEAGDTGTLLEAGQAEAGHVVFCNRAMRMETTNFDDPNSVIKLFNRTRASNAFNWLTLNLGSGEHVIRVFADLEHSVDDAAALAKAAVGKRTLIVEPAKLANDATI